MQQKQQQPPPRPPRVYSVGRGSPSIEIYRKLRKIMKIYGNILKPIEIYRNPLESMEIYRNLPASYQHPTSIIPASYQHPTSILPASYQHPTRILPASYQHPTRILPERVLHIVVHAVGPWAPGDTGPEGCQVTGFFCPVFDYFSLFVCFSSPVAGKTPTYGIDSNGVG